MGPATSSRTCGEASGCQLVVSKGRRTPSQCETVQAPSALAACMGLAHRLPESALSVCHSSCIA